MSVTVVNLAVGEVEETALTLAHKDTNMKRICDRYIYMYSGTTRTDRRLPNTTIQWRGPSSSHSK